MSAYYNEIDAYAAQWLRNLIERGFIAAGDVDERSILNVSPDDVRRYKQCHFFAGIGGWSLAARLASWPDDRPLWTGSCPCQPFSVAGKGLGTDDPRHLWPYFFNLISAVRPPVVMGEQVAGAAGYGWLDGVIADLERESYAGRGVDIPACAVDAPHIRSRLYWVAQDMGDADSGGCGEGGKRGGMAKVHRSSAHAELPLQERGAVHGGDMADANHERRDGFHPLLRADAGGRDAQDLPEAAGRGAGHMADADQIRCDGRPSTNGQQKGADTRASRGGGSFWSDAIWLTGADGKSRRAKPGIPLLAHGVPSRVGRLRAYGNAIVPPLAAEVIRAFMECEP